jgi:hypothetical protein
MQSKEKLITLCGLHKEETELDFSGYSLHAGDAVLIANDISDMRAMTSLDISNAALVDPETTIAPPQQGLKKGGQVNGRVILDVYANGNIRLAADLSGVFAVANAIKDMGAMSTFIFSGDDSSSKPVTMEISMTEADFSGKNLGASGALLVAAFLPKCTYVLLYPTPLLPTAPYTS